MGCSESSFLEIEEASPTVRVKRSKAPTMAASAVETIAAKMKNRVVKHRYICAIDFGLAATGYAFNEKDGTDKTIVLSDWGNGLCKTETSIVTDSGDEVKWFGSEASTRYANLGEETRNYNHFSRFKMRLFKKKQIDLNTTVKSSTGNKKPACLVISQILIYIRDHFFTNIKKATRYDLKPDEVVWVLTVPAIWDNAAKQLMRHAAKKAQLWSDSEPERLRIVHEPEAAGIFCATLSMARFAGESGSMAAVKPGQRIVVVDCGGGTADISVLEKKTDGLYKICVAPSGGPWGGNSVSNAVFGAIIDTVGKDTVDKWHEEDPEGFVELRSVIENKKHIWDGDDSSSLVIRVPAGFTYVLDDADINLSAKAREQGERLGGQFSYSRGCLTIGCELVKNFFAESTEPTCNHLEEMHNKGQLQDVQIAFVVGGFANSKVLQSAIKQKLHELDSNIQVLIPIDATSSILKGAVQMTSMWIAGNNPISSRISERTYGISYARTYNPATDKGKRTFQSRGKTMLADCFKLYVRAGEEIPYGFTKTQSFRYTERNIREEEVTDEIYSSDKQNVEFITDPSCRLEAKVRSKIPVKYSLQDEATTTTAMIFGDTEIKVVTIDDKSGALNDANIDFMSAPKA